MTPRRRRFELRPAAPPAGLGEALDYFSDRAGARQEVRDRIDAARGAALGNGVEEFEELAACADEADLDLRLLLHAARVHLTEAGQ